jgi:hypothetical protein
MATEINIATYDENGVPVVRPMTETELAEFLEMQANAQTVSPLMDLGNE